MSKRKSQVELENGREKKQKIERKLLEYTAAKHLSTLSKFELEKLIKGPIVTSHPPLFSIVSDAGIMHWNCQENQYMLICDETFCEHYGEDLCVYPIFSLDSVLVFVMTTDDGPPKFIMMNLYGKIMWQQPMNDVCYFEQKSKIGKFIAGTKGKYLFFFLPSKTGIKMVCKWKMPMDHRRVKICAMSNRHFALYEKTNQRLSIYKIENKNGQYLVEFTKLTISAIGKIHRRANYFIHEHNNLFVKYYMKSDKLISSPLRDLVLDKEYSIHKSGEQQLVLNQKKQDRIRHLSDVETVIPINSELYVTVQDGDYAYLHCRKETLYKDLQLWAVPISRRGMPEETKLWAKTFQERLNFKFTFPLDLWFMVAEYI